MRMLGLTRPKVPESETAGVRPCGAAGNESLAHSAACLPAQVRLTQPVLPQKSKLQVLAAGTRTYVFPPLLPEQTS